MNSGARLLRLPLALLFQTWSAADEEASIDEAIVAAEASSKPPLNFSSKTFVQRNSIGGRFALLFIIMFYIRA